MAEKNPFTFDSVNTRFVTNTQAPTTVYMAAGAIFLLSMRSYNRRYFRLDSNLMNLLGFAAISAPCSYTYANFFFNSAENEAALINNQRETAPQ